MEDQSTFWMCFAEGKGAPTVRHKTHSEAITEAMRLSMLNNGRPVYVLRATAVARAEPCLKELT